MRPSALRAAVASHLAVSLEALGWRESTYPFPLFPELEARGGLHKTFAVGLRTEGVGPARQRTSEGLVVQTGVSVRFAADLSVGTLEAYDAALDAEQAIVAALAAPKTAAPAVPIRVENIQSREARGDGTVFVGEVTCSVLHVYPLAD